MTDVDPLRGQLRSGFAEIESSVRRLVKPPGAEAVYRTLRRRRAVRAAGMSVVIALALVAAFLAPWSGRGQPPPPLSPSQSPALPSPSGAASPSPSPTAVPTATGSAALPAGRDGGQPEGKASPTCWKNGWISLGGLVSGSRFTVEVDVPARMCPDDVMPFFWAWYRFVDEDTLGLVASGRGSLDYTHKRRTVTMPGAPSPCEALFIVDSDGAIKQSIPWPNANYFDFEAAKRVYGELVTREARMPYSRAECFHG